MNRYVEIEQNIFAQALAEVKAKIKSENEREIQLVWDQDNNIRSIDILKILGKKYHYILYGVISSFQIEGQVPFREFSDNNKQELSELLELLSDKLAIKIRKRDDEVKCRLESIYCESINKECGVEVVTNTSMGTVLLVYKLSYV